jgi:hypothetical protein
MLSSGTFRTPLPNPERLTAIDRSHQLLLIGSCFTEHIGQRLQDLKFKSLLNPFGIVYNPSSMAMCLERLVRFSAVFSADDLFLHQDLWHSWDHHGAFSHPDKAVALDGMNQAYLKAVDALQKTDVLLLTLGTADVFVLRENGHVVANNHKMPEVVFDKKRLSVAEITTSLAGALAKVQQIRPDIKIILSISPVRHLRLGLVENQRSKASLVLACAEICQQLPNCQYFPSYELLMDDLRDYRFYAADMIHPNDTAIEYVWAHFSKQFFTAETIDLNEKIEKCLRAVRHRPLHPTTEAYRLFMQKQLELTEALQKKYPQLDFSEELRVFSNK